jgi:hypothetical protein
VTAPKVKAENRAKCFNIFRVLPLGNCLMLLNIAITALNNISFAFNELLTGKSGTLQFVAHT